MKRLILTTLVTALFSSNSFALPSHKKTSKKQVTAIEYSIMGTVMKTHPLAGFRG